MCTNLTIARRSQCPANDWKDSLAKVWTHDDMSFLNIGANKGYNILEFLLRHDSGRYPTIKRWYNSLLRNGVNQHACGVCNACLQSISTSQSNGRVNRIVGVELLTNNYNVLVKMCEEFIPRAHIIHAAAVKTRSTVAYEPIMKRIGHETIGISKKGRPVPIVTLDELINGSTWDMISVDAEGWDAEILQGGYVAISTRKIRVIEFEYSGKWKTQLRDTVQWLSSFKYKCFWTGTDGHLASINPECADIEIHKWSNVACAHEGELISALQSHVDIPRA